jgi:hypothetical protein
MLLFFWILASPWASSAGAAVSPKRVVATRNAGIKKIAKLTVGPIGKKIGPSFAKARRVLGRPDLLRKPDGAVCNALYRPGLVLSFTSFGGSAPCRKLSLQTADVKSPRWKVRVGKKIYRVGMPKRRIPSKAKRVPFFGWQLASAKFFGRQTGTVFARVGGKGRISSFILFIGGAGD